MVNNKIITPSEETIDCYNKYLQEYRCLFQNKIKTSVIHSEQIESHKQEGLTYDLAEQICFIESIGT